jgi:hypothetical protein
MNRAAHQSDQIRSIAMMVRRSTFLTRRRKAVTRLLTRTVLLFGTFAAITPAQAGTVVNGPAGKGKVTIALASNGVAVNGATLDDAAAIVIGVRTPR